MEILHRIQSLNLLLSLDSKVGIMVKLHGVKLADVGMYGCTCTECALLMEPILEVSGMCVSIVWVLLILGDSNFPNTIGTEEVTGNGLITSATLVR